MFRAVSRYLKNAQRDTVVMVAAGASGAIGVIWLAIAIDRVLSELLREEWAALCVALLFIAPAAIIFARRQKRKKAKTPLIEAPPPPAPLPVPLLMKPARVNSVSGLATLVAGRILIDQFPRTSTVLRRWLTSPM